MNKTQIFKDQYEFWSRENKKINGVSPEFAERNPEWEKQNETNKGCWNCSYCSGCSYCSYCSCCSDCSDLEDYTPTKASEKYEYPIIENIHNKLLEAVSKPDALYMGDWHKDKSVNDEGAYCGTTHCRAGWIVALAGKPGRELEQRTSTLYAAMQIYHKSSPNIKVSPPRFYESNEIAMADIIRCAEEERKLNQN